MPTVLGEERMYKSAIQFLRGSSLWMLSVPSKAAQVWGKGLCNGKHARRSVYFCSNASCGLLPVGSVSILLLLGLFDLHSQLCGLQRWSTRREFGFLPTIKLGLSVFPFLNRWTWVFFTAVKWGNRGSPRSLPDPVIYRTEYPEWSRSTEVGGRHRRMGCPNLLTQYNDWPSFRSQLKKKELQRPPRCTSDLAKPKAFFSTGLPGEKGRKHSQIWISNKQTNNILVWLGPSILTAKKKPQNDPYVYLTFKCNGASCSFLAKPHKLFRS